MRQRPFRPNEVTGVAVRIFFQVILMLGLGLPERTGRSQLGDNLARPKAGSIDIGDGVFRDPLLRVAGIEDGRPIARAPVVALAVQRRGIMDLEKEFQQLAIADGLRIEDDLDALRRDCRGCDRSRSAPRRRCSRPGLKSRRDSGACRSCTPQKQPPARTARSVETVMAVLPGSLRTFGSELHQERIMRPNGAKAQ